jgi:aldehyde reductase
MKLNDGNKIPIVGLGTYNLGDEAQKTKSILDAIDVGFRFFDTAFEYDNEKAIGKALTQALNSGKVKREDLFITTKIWGTYHRRPKVIEGLKISLHDLNITYADLVLVHWPTGFQEGNNTFPKSANGSLIPRTMEKDAYLDCWKGLEDAHKLGLAKSIGVANFNKRQLQRVLDTAVIKPAINQVSY